MTETVPPEQHAPPAAVRSRTYDWSDPVQTAAAGASLSGVEFFTAILEGRIPVPPIMKTLDLDGVEFSEGRFGFSLVPMEFHFNPIGSVHGGILATMLDSACGCAVHSRLPAGVFYTSLDLSVKFLRPASVRTGRLSALGTVVHLGRRTALAEAQITDATGRIYATATSSCLIVHPEQ
jgi:uncharacterized protein (TIGR00369 family)